MGLGKSIFASSFWIPEYTEAKSAWIEHAPFAFWLVDVLRPRTVVELGTHEGFSYFSFCQAVAELELSTRCFAVDTWKGDEHAGFYGEEVFERVRDHNLNRYSSFSKLIRSSFNDAKDHFEANSIDLLHLDGRHFYEDVRHDFESWKGTLSDKAVVIFHDTNVRERGFGVFRFWAELARDYPHFEFYHGHGLGVLGFGKNLQEPLRSWFAQGDVAATATRIAYARLGHDVAMRVGLDQLETNSAASEEKHAADISKLKAQLSYRDAEISKFTTELKQSRDEHSELRKTLESQAVAADRLISEKDRLERRIASLTADLADERAKRFRRMLRKAKKTAAPPDNDAARQKVAMVVHAYYPDVFREILKFVRALPEWHKLFVTTTTENETTVRNLLTKSNRAYSLLVVPNRGRDVLPFIKIFPELHREGYNLLVKLHTKKSPHRKDGRQWRKDAFGKLLDIASFERSLHAFDTDPSLGMIGPEGHYISMSAYIGANEESVRSIGARLGMSEPEIRAQGFFAGTMFMARTDALRPLLDLEFDDEDFDPETGQFDGTLAHALERAMTFSVVASGQRIASTANPQLWPHAEERYRFARKSKLRHRLRKGALRAVRHDIKRRFRFLTRRLTGDSRSRARLWSKFDRKFYLKTNPDVAAAGVDPFEHYVTFGRNEGRLGAPSRADRASAYQIWFERHDLNPGQLHRLAREIAALPAPPLISVVMPVYNTPESLLREAIDSVRNQIYGNWEFCIADDCSTQPHIRRVLEDYAAREPRIKLVFREENGHISRATNSGFALATGDWVALLDHDDILRPHALAEVALEIARYPQAELIYSDEDKLNSKGERYDPYFKPDFSRELFRSQNYLNHLTVHRAANIRAVGGWRPGFEGSQDYDLNLRIIERIDMANIRHIPKVLYHWRAVEGSTAASGSEKNYAYVAGLRALEEHIARMNLPAKAEKAPGTPFYRMRFSVPKPQPLVSLIIPARDKVELTRGCVESIREKTTYMNYEVIIVDNGSTESETLAYFAEIAKRPNMRILRYDAPFNYSAINNFAVRQAKGSIVGLINNDIEVISPDWLTEMVSWAAQDDVGCVGAKLYYPNNTIQHAGVILGLGGVAGHSHKHSKREDNGYLFRLKILQNLSAVTAACLLVRRSVYDEVGGLDETDLTVAFNDVDFCLKVREAGYLNVWTPYAEAYHHESVSRGTDTDEEKRERFDREIGHMQRKWSSAFLDPYYSPNLTRHREDFSFFDR